MRIAILSKEFRDGEAITEYCKSLSGYLAEQGHEVVIVSFDDGSYYSIDERVEVNRVPLHYEGDSIYNWAMMLNNELKKKVIEIHEEEEFDIIHSNDWTTVPGGVAVSKHLEAPLVVTFQSTENVRGFEGEHAPVISELEWQAGFEAQKVVATNEDVKNSLLFDLDVPEPKISVIDPYNDGWQEEVLNTYEELVKTKKEVYN